MAIKTFDIPNGFILLDEAAVSEKLADFAAAGKGKLHVLFDFDGTITTYEHNGRLTTTWQVLSDTLPPEAHEERLPVYEKFRALEVAGKMTPQDAEEWVNDSLARFVQYRLNLPEVEKTSFQHFNLRGQTKELFSLCNENGIPTIILSVGIKDLLEMLCKHYGLKPEVILAADARLDEKGRMVGWDPDTTIHAFNKRERGHKEISVIRDVRPYTILIGDSLPDVHMADGDKVLKIRIYDPRKDEAGDREKHIAQSFEAGFDMVFEGGFGPVIKLLENLGAG
jgi:HAD superfamily phosphoserine phosphatase-like hydrolase